MDGSLRIAGAGDIHASRDSAAGIAAAFADLVDVGLVLLAGDLTTCGQPEEASVLADACTGLDVPVFAVLGNHDWHADRTHELVAVLTDGGIRVLERTAVSLEVSGLGVGIVGLKGFVGGFPDSALPDFGEPLLRQVYAVTTEDVEALERGLAEIAACELRIVLMHYSPSVTTLAGEPPGIWAFLGSDRLAEPIRAHAPDLVLHGHAHAGSFAGSIGSVPVYNVAMHVTGRNFWIFEFDERGRLIAHDTNGRPATGLAARSSRGASPP
jgi:Icc-related predicted phosphoesterase